MGTLGVVLLVAFVIVCILLVLLVLVQDSGENGMGGLLGGRSTAAFGSHSASVLSKATFVLVILFFVLVLGLALINKKPAVEKDLMDGTAVETTEEAAESANENWWVDEAEASDAAVVESTEPVAETTETETATNTEVEAEKAE